MISTFYHRLLRALDTTRTAYQERGAGNATKFVLRLARQKAGLVIGQLNARRSAKPIRQSLRQDRLERPEGRPRIAVMVSGGIGDYLVIARFLRDLSNQVGDACFDVFCSRPNNAAWAFGGVP